MQFTSLDLIVVVAYLCGIGGLGIYQAGEIKSSGDFFAGGRRFSKFMMLMHTLGTGTHSDDPVGVAGACYQRGLSGIWYTYAYLFVAPFYWLIAPVFRRSRYLTTSDFFEGRYSSSLGLLYTFMGVLTFTVNMGTMLKGTGLIATVVTESVQGVLIVTMSLLLVPFGLYAVGGFAGLRETVDAALFDLHAPAELSIPWIFAATIASLIGIVAQGSMEPLAHREEAFGTAIRVLLPAGFSGLMLAAILAAQMSTLSAFMVAASALLTRNVYARYISPGADEKRLVRIGRTSGLSVVALGTLFAFIVPGVAEALLIFWAITTFTGVAIWGGVLWRRANPLGAWLSFLTMAAIWLALGPVGLAMNEHLPGASWLGLYGANGQLHYLLAAYLPAGVLALVTGSLMAAPWKRRSWTIFTLSSTRRSGGNMSWRSRVSRSSTLGGAKAIPGN